MQPQPITKQFVAVRAVIEHEGKILVIRESAKYNIHDAQKYDFPGGKIKPGESLQETIKREVEEEAGITDFQIGPAFFADEWYPIVKGEQIQIIGIFFLCKANTSHVNLSPDHDDYKWLSPQEITVPMLDANKRALQSLPL